MAEVDQIVSRGRDMYHPTPGEVFISYKRERRSEARKLAEALACYGVEAWYDRSLKVGEDFREQLMRQLAVARIVVVLWCPLSVDAASFVCSDEAPYAASTGKLLGVQVKGCEIPSLYKKLHTISLVDWDRLPDSQHGGFQSLVGEIDRRLGRRLVFDIAAAQNIRQVLAQHHLPGSCQPFRDDEALPSPAMIAVPDGQFLMGSPADEPERERPPMTTGAEQQDPLRRMFFEHPFAVSKTPVTRREFRDFADATGLESARGAIVCRNDRIAFDPKAHWREPHSKAHPREPGIEQPDEHPVTCVTWYEAKAYTQWLSARTGLHYRLLSEAEWEYAARATGTGAFGGSASISPDAANYDWRLAYAGGDRRWGYPRGTNGVGSYVTTANHWGLVDMHGNVAEWCEDVWHPRRTDAPQDGRALADRRAVGAADDLRVTRGGSWRDGPRDLRCAARAFAPALLRADNIGFRVVRELPRLA